MLLGFLVVLGGWLPPIRYPLSTALNRIKKARYPVAPGFAWPRTGINKTASSYSRRSKAGYEYILTQGYILNGYPAP